MTLSHRITTWHLVLVDKFCTFVLSSLENIEHKIKFMETIQQHITQVQNLCNQYHVLRLYTFGSVLTDKFNTDSDIDFLVDFDKVNAYEYADNFFDFKYALQNLFHRDIDLLESKAISNPFFKNNVDKSKQLIYG